MVANIEKPEARIFPFELSPHQVINFYLKIKVMVEVVLRPSYFVGK